MMRYGNTHLSSQTPNHQKEFKKYELVTAMKFKSVYAMRFYEPLSGQTKPLFVSLEGPDGLRERFCLQNKYKLTADFRRYVIDVAKKELDESSPYSFVTEEEKEGKKVIGWILFPVFYEDREDPALQEQTRLAENPKGYIIGAIKRILKENLPI